jgi:hypothetical protein
MLSVSISHTTLPYDGLMNIRKNHTSDETNFAF